MDPPLTVTLGNFLCLSEPWVPLLSNRGKLFDHRANDQKMANTDKVLVWYLVYCKQQLLTITGFSMNDQHLTRSVEEA